MDYPTCKPRQVRQTCFSVFGSWNEYYNQIATTNHKKERVRITRKKLAHDIAKCIKSYHKELEVSGKRYTIFRD